MYIDSYSPKNEIGGGSATPLYTAPVRLAVLFVFIFLWLAKLAAYCSFMFNVVAWIRLSFLGK